MKVKVWRSEIFDGDWIASVHCNSHELAWFTALTREAALEGALNQLAKRIEGIYGSLTMHTNNLLEKQ